MYDFYIDKLLLPIAPEEVSIRLPDRNKKIDLINGEVMTILKKPGMRVVTFDCHLLNQPLPFMVGRYASPRQIIEKLESLKINQSSFQFVIIRKNAQGQRRDDTNLTAIVVDFTATESGANGSDYILSVQLEEFQRHSSKTIRLNNGQATVSVNTNSNRWETTGVPKTYVVKKGDTLHNIGVTHYNNKNAYKHIMANNGISNPDSITVGQILSLPEYFDIAYNNNKT